MRAEIIPASEAGTGRACPRHVAGTFLIGVIGWLVAAFVAVAVSMIPYDFEESICGVWGCFPPIQALISVHLLWCVALAGGFWALRKSIPILVRPVGILISVLATVGIAVLLGNDVPNWIEHTSKYPGAFWPKRVGFLIATETEVPLVQALLAGIWAARFEPARNTHCSSGVRT